MPPRKWGTSRSGLIPGAFGITRQSFNEIDTLISSLRQGTREFDSAMNAATHLTAKTNQGFIQKAMRGPVDPKYRFAPTYTVPVARRSQKTYHSWYVRRLGMGRYALTSHERGAFAIEFGLGGRPRPVLRNSALETMRFIQRTKFGNRIMKDTFGSLRDNKGRFRSYAARIENSNLLVMPGSMGYQSL